MSMPT